MSLLRPTPLVRASQPRACFPLGGGIRILGPSPLAAPGSLHRRSLPASLSVPLEAQAPSLESRSLPFPGAVGSKQQSPQKRRWLCPFSRPPSRRESRGELRTPQRRVSPFSPGAAPAPGKSRSPGRGACT